MFDPERAIRFQALIKHGHLDIMKTPSVKEYVKRWALTKRGTIKTAFLALGRSSPAVKSKSKKATAKCGDRRGPANGSITADTLRKCFLSNLEHSDFDSVTETIRQHEYNDVVQLMLQPGQIQQLKAENETQLLLVQHKVCHQDNP